jgi:hypothetical protein
MHLRPSLASLAAPCAAGAVLLLAACGGSAGGQASTRTQDEETKLVDFAKCLREHGVNASASPGGGLSINGGGAPAPGRSPASNQQTMEAAQKACQRYQPSGGRPNLTPQERVAREEAVQKFAKCMRQHGIKVETSTAGGGVAIRVHSSRGGGGGSGGPNPASPAFQAGQKACQGLLPFKGRHAPGPGAAQSGGVGGEKSGSGANVAAGG